MINPDMLLSQFNTVFLSKQKVVNPFTTIIRETINSIREKYHITSNIIVSMGFGKRIIINSEDDFIEVVDYNPIQNILLVIGRDNPSSETHIHWMIHRARDDINMVIQILDTNVGGDIPKVEYIDKVNNLDYIKSVLGKLGKGSMVMLENKSVLFVGRKPEDVIDLIGERWIS